MSLHAMCKVLFAEMADATDGKRTVSAAVLKAVLVGLAERAYDDGANAYPSVDRLVIYTGLNEGTVRHALSALQREGYIRQTRAPAPGRQAGYELNMHRLDTLQSPRIDRITGRLLPPQMAVPAPEAERVATRHAFGGEAAGERVAVAAERVVVAAGEAERVVVSAPTRAPGRDLTVLEPSSTEPLEEPRPIHNYDNNLAEAWRLALDSLRGANGQLPLAIETSQLIMLGEGGATVGLRPVLGDELGEIRKWVAERWGVTMRRALEAAIGQEVPHLFFETAGGPPIVVHTRHRQPVGPPDPDDADDEEGPDDQ